MRGDVPLLFHDISINNTFLTTFKMVPEGIKFARLPRVQKSANFIPKGAISKKECKKVLFNSCHDVVFFAWPTFFPCKKATFCPKIECFLVL